MKIGPFDTDQKVLIVAEIGNNHEGRVETALRLVNAAAQAGADAVKFQTYRTEHYVSRLDVERFQRLRRFELPWEAYPLLRQAARERGLLFFSTPFDLESAHRLSAWVDAFKISSGDNTFFPLLERVASFPQPAIISLGLCGESESREVIATAQRLWGNAMADKVAVLHCVTAYPTPPEQANLWALRALRDWFPGTIGYSDHTLGIDACLAAAAAGARVIEKHFTLDKAFSDFRDHAVSADPAEMATLVTGVRRVETLLGTPGKRPMPAEESAMVAVRRSIVAAADLPKGRILALSDLTWVRPGGGMAPGRENELVGRRLVRDVREGDLFKPTDVLSQ